VKLGDETAVW